jgi:3-dehydroquinate synthase
MAGFVAATFMRGIPVVQIPTTLLAMIDASIGGKTGVDTPTGKNLVGAFHPPGAVIIDPAVLDTLPLEHLRTGLAEAIKHGVIADEAYFSFLEELAPRLLASAAPREPDTLQVLARLIEWSVQIKAGVVAHDEREHGVRKILNFGHTIGHAIELLSNFSLAHGDAVAIGMVLESTAAEQAGVTDCGTTDRIVRMLRHVGLPTIRPAGPTPDQIIDLMLGDKKSRAGAIEYAVPIRLGVMANAKAGYGVRLDERIVRSVLTQPMVG